MRDRSLGSTIRLKFTTTDSNGSPVAPSSAFVAADFRIYKDGSATEKTTTNGITVTSPFDSVTGRHLIEIDTSNATGDTGFWASGSAYFVELNTAKTVNSQTVSGLEVGSFSLELQTADIRKFGGTALTQSGGRPEVNVSHLGGDSQSLADLKDFADAGYDPATNKLTGAVELDSASLRSALGMSAADLDSQLDAILAAATAGAGTGARTVTITVNDGTTVLQNAIVRFTEGSNTFRALTNASGVAVFNLDDATYTVAVTKSGYTYAGTTMVVNGTETATYSMTATSVTPPTNPDLSAVVVLCLGTDFEAQSGVTIDLRIKTLPSGSTNTAYPGIKQTATSNVSGIATLEAPKGSVCEWKRGKEDSWTEITIGSDDQTNVTSIIGSRY